MARSLQPLTYFSFYHGRHISGVIVRDGVNEIVLTKAEVMEMLEMINDSEQSPREG